MGIASEQGRVRRVSLLGPPGSGKSTLARQLASELSVPRISIGERLRERARRDHNLDAVLARGGFVTDGFAWDLVQSDLEAAQRQDTGYLLDGFPRTLPQRDLLEGVSASRDQVTFLLEIATADCIARLEGRREEGVERRTDDLEEHAIRSRFDLYRSETVPVIQAYREDRRLQILDATKGVDALVSDALRVI